MNFASTSSVQTTGECISYGACEEPPSVVTSDQPFFDPGTSTSGLSSGVTVGGNGSSLVQTTGEATERVDLPEVAVTFETFISPVQIFKRPARDACLCMGELLAPAAPPVRRLRRLRRLRILFSL